MKRLWLIVLVLLAVGCFVLYWLAHPSKEQICQTVVDALERFHDKHGRYPHELDKLVEEGFLDAIPAVPDDGTGEVVQRGLSYFVDQDADFYGLQFVYYQRTLFLPKRRYCCYLSAQGCWWEGEPLEDQAAGYAARQFRRSGSSKYLHLYFEASAENLTTGFLSKDNVVRDLGEGRAASVDGESGSVYQGKDGEGDRYFVAVRTEVVGRAADQVVTKLYVSDAAEPGGWRLKARKR
jgi:hypothetical protein